MTTVTMDRKALARALKVLAYVIPARSSIPAIHNVKLDANGSAVLIATDLEMGVALELERRGNGDGQTTIPVARLAAYVGMSKADDVTVQFEPPPPPPEPKADAEPPKDGEESAEPEPPAAPEPSREIALDGGRMKLVGGDVLDYPATPEPPKRAAVKIAAAELARGIKAASVAVSSECVRFALTGILLHVDKTHRNMVSSDGKRLIVVPIKGEGECRVILPMKLCAVLTKLCADAPDATAEFAFKAEGETKAEYALVHVRIGKASVWGRPIDGNFPDYEAVIPADRDKVYVLERKALLAAVEEVSIVTTDKTRAVRFSFAGRKCELFARTQDVGEARVSLACIVARAREDVEIVLNPDFVMEFLTDGADKAEAVELRVKDKTTGCVWTTGPDAPKYVLMPLTVNP